MGNDYYAARRDWSGKRRERRKEEEGRERYIKNGSIVNSSLKGVTTELVAICTGKEGHSKVRVND